MFLILQTAAPSKALRVPHTLSFEHSFDSVQIVNMQLITILTVLTTTALAAPASPGLNARQAKSCYVIGDSPLPAIVSSTSSSIENLIKCSVDGSKTLQNVPDVLAGNQAFSTIDFTQGGKTPLQFSMDLFQTAEPLANSDLQAFKDGMCPTHPFFWIA